MEIGVFDAEGYGPAAAPAAAREAAREAVREAVEMELLERPNYCGRCGMFGLIQAHHRSYRPEHFLAVVWLCERCHANEHTRLINIGVQPVKHTPKIERVPVADGLVAKSLTRWQAQIVEFMIRHMESRGAPPTIREIGRAMGISSTHGVNDHIRAMERKGFVTRVEGQARGLRVLRRPDGSPYERAA
jgi:hypothetical protein